MLLSRTLNRRIDRWFRTRFSDQYKANKLRSENQRYASIVFCNILFLRISSNCLINSCMVFAPIRNGFLNCDFATLHCFHHHLSALRCPIPQRGDHYQLNINHIADGSYGVSEFFFIDRTSINILPIRDHWNHLCHLHWNRENNNHY